MKEKERIDALRSVLDHLQRMHNAKRMLVADDWDWLVIMQCLQDQGLFKTNPRREPFAAFEAWITNNNMPQYLSQCSAWKMSKAHRAIQTKRYPWKDVTWNPYMLERWRHVYRVFVTLLEARNMLP